MITVFLQESRNDLVPALSLSSAKTVMKLYKMLQEDFNIHREHSTL